jgi:hypothetical protein
MERKRHRMSRQSEPGWSLKHRGFGKAEVRRQFGAACLGRIHPMIHAGDERQRRPRPPFVLRSVTNEVLTKNPGKLARPDGKDGGTVPPTESIARLCRVRVKLLNPEVSVQG